MTVKDVFDLRKQGRIEEAYEAIRPMYAQHKGRYTTLCMFWTAADVFKLRLDQSRTEEAEKILEALKRMLPRVEEVNKQLDREKGTVTPTVPQEKLPWEYDDKKQEGSSAAAFIASAISRLNKKTSSRASSEQEEINQPSRAASDTPEKSTGLTTPAPGITAVGGNNLQDLQDFAQQERRNQPSRASSEQEKKEPLSGEDLSGHLTVSIEDGIIRPIAGINAPQRIVLACLVAHPGYSVPQISDSTGIPQKSIERHISVLIERNLIEHRGSKKTGGYYAK